MLAEVTIAFASFSALYQGHLHILHLEFSMNLADF
jgi:hypothetical protein